MPRGSSINDDWWLIDCSLSFLFCVNAIHTGCFFYLCLFDMPIIWSFFGQKLRSWTFFISILIFPIFFCKIWTEIKKHPVQQRKKYTITVFPENMRKHAYWRAFTCSPTGMIHWQFWDSIIKIHYNNYYEVRKKTF